MEESKRAKRANGEGCWSRRKDGSWKLHMTYNGKPKDFYGKTKPEVIKKKKAYESLRTDCTNINSTTTVEKYATEWMVKIQKNKLKKKSYDRMQCTLRNWIIPQIGYMHLNKVEGIDIQEKVINEMYSANLSRESIKKARDTLNSMYKYAISIKKVDYNPVLVTAIQSIDKFDKKEIRYFSQDERERFVESCYSKYKNGRYIYNYGAFFVMMLYTGVRIGEALSLKWKDVDIKNRKMHIDSTIIVVSNDEEDEPNWIVEDQEYTKTNKERYIYLCDMAIEALSILQDRYGNNQNDYIINHNNKPINPRRAARAFKAICKRANIKNANPHCLRHSCASLMHSNNIPLSMISEYLGHANEATTAKIYIHLLADDKIASQSIIKDMH